MNNNNGAISFRALLDTKDFEQGRFKIESQLKSLTSMADQEASKFDSIFRRTGQAVAAYLTFDAARNLVGDIVKVRGEFQQLEIAFTTMLQSKSKADGFMRELIDFAATTPFDLKSTGAAAKQLLAYGSAAESVKGELTMLGDVAAALSVPIGELVYLYGTLRSQGRAYAVDIRQFAGRGIPIYAELAKVLKVGKDEVNALVEAGKVGFPQVEKAFQNMTAAGSIFGGLMEAQSQSIPGKIERLKDAWDQMLNSIGKEGEGVINGAIDSIAGLIENYQQVGIILAGLAGTYGTYRAAIALSSVITTAHLGIIEKETAAKLAAIDVTIAERTAVLSNIEAKAAEALATENQYRAEFALLAEKEAVALATVKSTAATLAEAEAKVASIRASTALGAARRLDAANAELSAAATAHSAATQEAETLTRNVNTKTVILNNQSKVANTLATEVNTAANNLSAVASTRAAIARNAETASISAMTGRQVLAAIATKAFATAQSIANATMLANPYVALTVAIVGLTATFWGLYDSTTDQERAIKGLADYTEKLTKKKDEARSSAFSLMNTLNNENESILKQVAAYKELIELLPELQGKSVEEIKGLSKDDFNRLIDAKAVKDTNVELENMKSLLEEIAVARKADAESGGSRLTSVENTVKKVKDIFGEGVNTWGAAVKVVEDRIEAINKGMQEEARIAAEIASQKEYEGLTLQQKLNWQNDVIAKLGKEEAQLTTILLVSGQTNSVFERWQNNLNGTAFALQDVAARLAAARNAAQDLNNQLAGGGSLSDVDNQLKQLTEEWNNLSAAERKAQRASYQSRKDALDKQKQEGELTTIKKPSTKKKKQEEKFLESSIKWYEKEIQKLQDRLDRLPVIPSNMDKVKDIQDKIFALTKARTEAEKAIEIRTWQEMMDEKLKMYHTYEEALRIAEENDKNNLTNGSVRTAADGSQVEVFDASEQVSQVDKVKAAYADLTQYGESRLDFLIAEKKRIDDIVASGEANYKVIEKLVKVQTELDVLQGNSTPVESFRKGIDSITASIKPYSEIIASLKGELEDLESNTPNVLKSTSDFVEKRKILVNAISDINKRGSEELSGYLVQLAGSEQKRAAIVLKYENLINEARVKGLETLDIEREMREELAAFETEKFNAQRGAAEIIQAQTLKDLKKEEISIREQINALIQKGYGNTLEVVRLQKKLKDNLGMQGDTVYSNTMMWVQALGQAGQSLSDLEGTAGNIGQLFSNLAQSVQNFNQIAANTKANNGKVGASDYAAAAQSAGSLISMVIGAAQRRKAKRKQEEANTLQTQLDLNKALIEEVRLRSQLSESVYVTDYYGRIKDSIEAMQMASVKAFEVMQKLNDVGKAKNGTRNKIDWGAVGAGAGSGAAIGAVAGGGVFSWLGAAIGAVGGALVGLFGAMKKDARYSGLFEIYPELISQSGEFNETLAKTLLANEQLDDKTKQYLQNLIDINEEWKAADKAITDIIGDLTGQMGGELRDVLVQAFEDGTDAAHAFADVVEKTLQNALENLIYSAVFSDVFKELQDRLKGSLTGGASFQEQFAWFMEQYGELNSQFKEAMEAAKQAGKDVGFDLWNGSEDRANGMTGAIKGITEEQAGVLAGNITQMRIKQAEHSELFRQQIFLLANISSNSNYLPELSRLGGILRILERMESDGFARSQGWQY
ncbi:MAG: hypothetical protein BGO31_14185 [Bacteroidetes bacterium 43-16]|nr:MAG: hypothetical protein BGO31_14185 [Bacteroidetes bacterium 43-16]